jgi:GNAT superfamily N-acetyltransferase
MDAAPQVNYSEGWWWIARNEDNVPAAFIGMIQSTLSPASCYFYRVGVLPSHRGHRLQSRLTRAMCAKARRLGYTSMVTDTTDNVPSANNLIKCGFTLIEPHPWSLPRALYWMKQL